MKREMRKREKGERDSGKAQKERYSRREMEKTNSHRVKRKLYKSALSSISLI